MEAIGSLLVLSVGSNLMENVSVNVLDISGHCWGHLCSSSGES